MLGTPDYIAPEQTLDATSADTRADIYSLGCTLYFLLAGYAPFRARSLYELLQAHQTSEARPLNLERPEVPVELATVVAKMMAKDPAKRYQKPVEVAQALLPFIKSGKRATAGPPQECHWQERCRPRAPSECTSRTRPLHPAAALRRRSRPTSSRKRSGKPRGKAIVELFDRRP
jgi:serine/threonine protein kinase